MYLARLRVESCVSGAEGFCCVYGFRATEREGLLKEGLSAQGFRDSGLMHPSPQTFNWPKLDGLGLA